MSLPDLPSGVWRHYKGPLYFVFGYGHDANAEDLCSLTEVTSRLNAGVIHLSAMVERAVVVYMALELTDAHTGPRLAVRTAEDFSALVCALEACEQYGKAFESDAFMGCIRCKTAPVPRFAYVGPTWEG